MGTRSVTMIDGRFTEYDWDAKKVVDRDAPVARFYRHFDGYPEGHGFDIAMALALVEAEGKTNNRNLAQHFLKRLCAMDVDIEFEPSTKEHGWEHGDLDYIYKVVLPCDNSGGKESDPSSAANAVIEVYEVGWGDDYAKTLGHDPLYSGGWRGFMEHFALAPSSPDTSGYYAATEDEIKAVLGLMGA